MIKVKYDLSNEQFTYFVEDIPIVKECIIENDKDALIKFNNGNTANVSLFVADTGYPKQIKEIISDINSDSYPVILAPYISEQSAKLCAENNAGYLDMAGNCSIALDSLYIERKGNKNNNIPKRSLKSIYEKSSTVSSLILRIMLEDISRIWKLKELAATASCSIGQVSKVKDFLLNQNYIEHTSDGIKIIKPESILNDWLQVYNINPEPSRQYYSLENIPVIESKISAMKAETGIDAYLTGFSGASRYQPVVRYSKVHLYIDAINIDKAVAYLNLKKVDSGGNVVIMVPYDDCVKYGSKIQKDSLTVSPVQLYLDCMNIKGRGEEMAQAILEREIIK
ncbi:MAG: type IV toxin-antitoxin system AbiEi family antitoxin [Erysipelotrichaceae bacterium]